ncbi:hypothetical protein AA313_de0205053 [Arthrobotrys entomopaga]|nr:hypothetical protein AA313_de0205053 [Arthrobotrys entomopaga]
MSHHRVNPADDPEARQRRLIHHIRQNILNEMRSAARHPHVHSYPGEQPDTLASPQASYHWEMEFRPNSNPGRAYSWRDGPYPPQLSRQESSISNRAVFGNDEYTDNYQNPAFVPPRLVQTPTWSSTQAQDGYESDDGPVDTRVTELLDGSSSSTSGEDIIEPYRPTTEPTQAATIHAYNAEQEIAHSGSVVELILFYSIVCILVVVLRNIPGFFPTLFGWNTLVGSDELGNGEGLEG